MSRILRVLFLSKRQPQRRDLIERPYGRFYHLPVALAELGHDVRATLCSHHQLASVEIERGGVRWSSHDLLALGPRRLMQALKAGAEAFQPDWVIGCSDTWYGWLAHQLARRTGAALAIDAYDNYESYMRWNLPLHLAWRRAIRAADVVTTAGPQLAELLQRTRAPDRRPVDILPMAADPLFVPHDRDASRLSLGLPADKPLIGYFGAWSATRDSSVLLAAFARLREQVPDVRLVLSGRPPAYALSEPGVHALGYIDDALLPIALSAVDVACVITADTAFGRYSYPSKLYEAMACRVPVVASATDAVRWVLKGREEHLAHLGDADHFAQRVKSLLERPRSDYGRQPDWDELAHRWSTLLEDAS